MFFLNILQVVSIPNNRDFSQTLELLAELIKRDLKAKYKNAFLGIVWVIIQPLVLAITFVLVKSEFTHEETITRPSYLNMFIVLIPWQFFVTSLQRSVDCVTSNNHLIYRVKFPIILLPVSVTVSALMDVLINILAYAFIMLLIKDMVVFKIFFLLLVLLISGFFISALSILFALLQCFIADVRQFVPFLTKLSLFVLPILYNEDIIPENIRQVYIHIPLVWMVSKAKEIVEGRFFFLADETTMTVLLISTVSLILSCLILRRFESFIVDYI